MQIYNYHPETGDFLSVGFADPNPRYPDDWLIPGNATAVEPPEFDAETETCRWNGSEWIVADIVIDEPDEPDPPTPEELWIAYQNSAMMALNVATMVAINCFKVGIAYPTEWLDYSRDLTAIINASSGDPSIALPTVPEYPAAISGL